MPAPDELAFLTATPSLETVVFNDALERNLAVLPPPEEVDIDLARALRAEGKGILPIDPPAEGARWETTPLGGQVRVFEPDGPARGVYIHIHGGGWTFGAPDQADGRMRRLTQETGARVMSLRYRLAPENKWPACAEDCLAGALWAIEAAGDLPVVIGGESAGAHLSVATLLQLRDRGLAARVSGVLLSYGCFDLRLSPSARNWGPRNLILSTPIVRWFAENLLSDPAREAEGPAASPLLADLSGMPPALFQIGALDPLLDDTLFMTARWRAAGGAAELVGWPGGVHAFDYFDHPQFKLPMALEMQARSARFIAERFASAA